MVAQTVPTSARYIDKLTTVGTCSASRENEATRTSDCSPRLRVSVSEGSTMRRSPNSCKRRDERSEGRLTINA